MEELKLFIGGQWVDGRGTEKILVENPATKECFASVPRGTEEDVNLAVEAAKKGFALWKNYSGKERAECLYKLSDYFQTHSAEIAETITKELGAPVSMAEDWHVSGAAGEAEFNGDAAKNFKYEEAFTGYLLRREPFGIVAAVTPWNYPLDQITLKVLPALAAGNCVILKPSQMTPLSAYWFARGIEEAGFPAGVFNLVTGCGKEVGDVLASHPDIRMISFTGSTGAGREVGRLALSNIKKCTLELGGKSAAIVLPGADYKQAVDAVLTDCFMNTGQTCNAITRMLIPASSKKEIEEMAIQCTKEFVVGDPQDPTVDIGPLINQKAFDKVKKYIETGTSEGARMLIGEIPEGCEKGYYVKPVIFTDVTNSMKIAVEEIFGPVLCLITYETVEEAIAIANDSVYGLCGGVFGPEEEAIEAARQMETGVVCINGSAINTGAPFGGYKESGIGRESCIQSVDEYLEMKAICLPLED